jgi:energy-coupling factor transporter ATP-binding protein EcfA2
MAREKMKKSIDTPKKIKKKWRKSVLNLKYKNNLIKVVDRTNKKKKKQMKKELKTIFIDNVLNFKNCTIQVSQMTLLVGPLGGGKSDLIRILKNFMYNPEHEMFENGTVRLEFGNFTITNSNKMLSSDISKKFTKDRIKKFLFFMDVKLPVEIFYEKKLSPEHVRFVPVFELTKNFQLLTEEKRKELNETFLKLINREVILVDFISKQFDSEYLGNQKIQLKSDGVIFDINDVEAAVVDTLKILIALYSSDRPNLILENVTNSFPPGYLKKFFFVLNALPTQNKKNIIMLLSSPPDTFNWFIPQKIYHFTKVTEESKKIVKIENIGEFCRNNYQFNSSEIPEISFSSSVVFAESDSSKRILKMLKNHIVENELTNYNQFLKSTIIRSSNRDLSSFAKEISTPFKFVDCYDESFHSPEKRNKIRTSKIGEYLTFDFESLIDETSVPEEELQLLLKFFKE